MFVFFFYLADLFHLFLFLVLYLVVLFGQSFMEGLHFSMKRTHKNKHRFDLWPWIFFIEIFDFKLAEVGCAHNRSLFITSDRYRLVDPIVSGFSDTFLIFFEDRWKSSLISDQFFDRTILMTVKLKDKVIFTDIDLLWIWVHSIDFPLKTFPNLLWRK